MDAPQRNQGVELVKSTSSQLWRMEGEKKSLFRMQVREGRGQDRLDSPLLHAFQSYNLPSGRINFLVSAPLPKHFYTPIPFPLST